MKLLRYMVITVDIFSMLKLATLVPNLSHITCAISLVPRVIRWNSCDKYIHENRLHKNFFTKFLQENIKVHICTSKKSPDLV